MISNFTIWSLQYFPNFSKQIHCHCFPKILFLKVKSSEVQHSINLCMLIHDWNSFEIYIKEICALCQWQASGYDSPKKKKKKDYMSEGNIKTNSPALQWLHRTVYIRSVHWTGIFHFIHHLQLAAVILRNQSIPLAHTKKKKTHPMLSLLENSSVWGFDVSVFHLSRSCSDNQHESTRHHR